MTFCIKVTVAEGAWRVLKKKRCVVKRHSAAWGEKHANSYLLSALATGIVGLLGQFLHEVEELRRLANK